MKHFYKTFKMKVSEIASGETKFEIDNNGGEVFVKLRNNEEFIDLEQNQRVFLTLQTKESFEESIFENGRRLLNEILLGTF